MAKRNDPTGLDPNTNFCRFANPSFVAAGTLLVSGAQHCKSPAGLYAVEYFAKPIMLEAVLGWCTDSISFDDKRYFI